MNERQATWVFRSGRRARLESAVRTPTEFFYGLPELRDRGWKTTLLEDADLGMAPPLKPLPALVNRFARFCGYLPLGMAMGLASKQVQKKLPDQGPIIATTNNLGLALGMGRARGRVRCPVVLLAMGLLPLAPSQWQVRRVGEVLKHIHVVTISKAEQAHLARLFPNQKIDYIPFGVDTNFWEPAPEGRALGEYVMAIGNDANRDWKTLIDAWDETMPPLKLITNLHVPPAPPNVEIIKGDWRSQTLSDAEILKLYQQTSCVVIPLHNTIQPAGQSVCLQAMACGRPVIISDTYGIWDRAQFIDGKHWWLSRPGDASSLRTLINKAQSHESRKTKNTNARGQEILSELLSTNEMAFRLEGLLNAELS